MQLGHLGVQRRDRRVVARLRLCELLDGRDALAVHAEKRQDGAAASVARALRPREGEQLQLGVCERDVPAATTAWRGTAGLLCERG